MQEGRAGSIDATRLGECCCLRLSSNPLEDQAQAEESQAGQRHRIWFGSSCPLERGTRTPVDLSACSQGDNVALA